MSLSRYLHGLQTDPFEGCVGIFVADHYRAGSYRYLTTYADGKRHKARIFDLLKRYGQIESRGRWDLHHVVEGQHFADIDFTGELPTLYKNALPCVLIERNEHIAYNQLLHVRETDELFRERLPSDMLQRSAHVAALARDRREHGTLRLQVQKLRQLYRRAYEGDHVLQKVADNVFDVALAQLR